MTSIKFNNVHFLIRFREQTATITQTEALSHKIYYKQKQGSLVLQNLEKIEHRCKF